MSDHWLYFLHASPPLGFYTQATYFTGFVLLFWGFFLKKEEEKENSLIFAVKAHTQIDFEKWKP